jgi:hypothetical protein
MAEQRSEGPFHHLVTAVLLVHALTPKKVASNPGMLTLLENGTLPTEIRVEKK